MTEPKPLGFSIRIFLPDGRPDGLKFVEKTNWTGRGLVCPRPRFPAEKTRPEFSRTGVYILTGPSEAGGLPRVYIGEGDPIRPRLEQHHAKKDFWTSAVLFTSKDENLNKAHIQYLESRLVSLAAELKQCVLENGNAPQLPSLSEPDATEIESFLAEMLLIFPVLGISLFERPTEVAASTLLFYCKAKGLTARGYESSDGFVVKKGSQASGTEAPSIQKWMSDQRSFLGEKGVLVPEGDHQVFSQDYRFSSPTLAAAVVLGGIANGRTVWKDKDGRTLKEIQSAGTPGAAESSKGEE
jgi:hypothetical protein